MAKVREAIPEEVERVLGMYEWLFAPPGSVPPHWDPEHARTAIADAMASPAVTSTAPHLVPPISVAADLSVHLRCSFRSIMN